ncbi:hypothetical protein ACFOZ7_10740 [Natribaculum luteum]|uniref:Uncharacterized protein n=1 Tax=Natribaculum luteum TaxID=1586232 RepID=A0ABD5P0J0_9EURY|nr:hypothetical protein [Natribaculum luteum]
MNDRDDAPPGTSPDEIDEDARPSKQEPDAEAIEEPTRDSKQEARETAWMMKEGTTIGVVSILAVLLLALALMQATGLVDLMAPLADTQLGQWGAFAALALVVAAVFAWSRWGV